MTTKLIESIIELGLAVVGTFYLMQWAGLPTTWHWCMTCAAALFLRDLYRA